MLDLICQAGIAVFGLAAIRMVRRGDARGYVVGLMGQVFWLAATWRGGQWGMLALALAYAWEWRAGMAAHWDGRFKR